MYKVYVNGLLCVLTNHCYTIFRNGYEYPPHASFADDITLLALHPSFLKTFMSICYKYGINGDTNSITPEVELLHLVNLSHNILNP